MDSTLGLALILFALSVVLAVAMVFFFHRERRELRERRRTEAELRDRENKLRVLVNSQPAIIWTTDRNLRFTSSEGAGLASLGLDRGEVVGQKLQDYFQTTDENYPPLRAHLRALKGESNSYEFNQENVSFQVYVEPLRNEAGKIAGALGLAVDVSEGKIAREELRERERQLFQAQKMEALGSLAGGIAHDFNNILTPILGYAHMALQESGDNEQLRHDLTQVVKAGTRARDLVRQILTFGRYSEGKLLAKDLRETVAEASKLLRASIPATVEIKTELAEQPLMVAADPTHIHQIVLNLGTNGYHAMRTEGGVLHIEVDEAELTEKTAQLNPGVRPGSFARIVVSDTGEGMPPEVLERIFEPFFTTKEVGKGTGLGLSVVHGIVTSLHGVIQAHSAIGEGSRFEIYVPLGGAEKDLETPSDLPTVGGGEHILVVDDEEMITLMLDRLLTASGYRVTMETDSLAALERIRAGEVFDLVLTDQTMPGLTGIEMARRIQHVQPGIPILLITGYGDTLNADTLKESGIGRYLMKPVTPGRLEQVIRETLRDARATGGEHGQGTGD